MVVDVVDLLGRSREAHGTRSEGNLAADAGKFCGSRGMVEGG